ncbi:unnamed protein product, partial [Staurois parvus]
VGLAAGDYDGLSGASTLFVAGGVGVCARPVQQDQGSNQRKMSLQWTAVATFLYAEVFLVLLLCIPFISPTRWQKIFKSRLVQLIVAYGNTFFVVLIVILLLLLLDAFREIQKYGVGDQVDLKNNPVAVEHIHMKLFRAQRNLYIAGFSLLLAFLLRRLVTLISKQATIIASNEAFKKQAESASDAAKKFMDENDKEEATKGRRVRGLRCVGEQR